MYYESCLKPIILIEIYLNEIVSSFLSHIKAPMEQRSFLLNQATVSL